jgi:hypothetical protein
MGYERKLLSVYGLEVEPKEVHGEGMMSQRRPDKPDHGNRGDDVPSLPCIKTDEPPAEERCNVAKN